MKSTSPNISFKHQLPNVSNGFKRVFIISHKLLRLNQFLEEFMEILELSTLQKEVSSLPLLNVAAYWKSLRQQPVSDTCKQH